MKTGQIQMGLQNGSGSVDSGYVNVDNTGSVFTGGEDSPAVLLQSISGGGGRADQYYGNVQLGLTGNGGSLSAQSGNTSLLNNAVEIRTTGNSSPALVAQSIGGGGGFVGEQIGSIVGLDWIGRLGSGKFTRDQNGVAVSDVSGDILNAGSVDVLNTSLISTQGNVSPGLVAQSVGGGGGYAGGMKAPIISLGANGPISSNS